MQLPHTQNINAHYRPQRPMHTQVSTKQNNKYSSEICVQQYGDPIQEMVTMCRNVHGVDSIGDSINIDRHDKLRITFKR